MSCTSFVNFFSVFYYFNAIVNVIVFYLIFGLFYYEILILYSIFNDLAELVWEPYQSRLDARGQLEYWGLVFSTPDVQGHS